MQVLTITTIFLKRFLFQPPPVHQVSHHKMRSSESITFGSHHPSSVWTEEVSFAIAVARRLLPSYPAAQVLQIRVLKRRDSSRQTQGQGKFNCLVITDNRILVFSSILSLFLCFFFSESKDMNEHEKWRRWRWTCKTKGAKEDLGEVNIVIWGNALTPASWTIDFLENFIALHSRYATL